MTEYENLQEAIKLVDGLLADLYSVGEEVTSIPGQILIRVKCHLKRECYKALGMEAY